MVAAPSNLGLRERKKQRTRETIVDVATRLFVEQGYHQTTLAQIAKDADVAPSTFFNYFPTKVDIVFCVFDAVIDSARARIAERPEGETAMHAIAAWLREDLLDVEQPYAETLRRFPTIVESAPELVGEERLRLAQLEDVLAAGFARDLGESPDGMRARVLAAIALPRDARGLGRLVRKARDRRRLPALRGARGQGRVRAGRARARADDRRLAAGPGRRPVASVDLSAL